MTEEGKIQSKQIKVLEEKGYYVIKLAKTNKNGIPDLLALKTNCRPLFIESKAPKGKLSEIQKHRIKELKKHGFTVYASASSDIRFYSNEAYFPMCSKEVVCSNQCSECKDFVYSDI